MVNKQFIAQNRPAEKPAADKAQSAPAKEKPAEKKAAPAKAEAKPAAAPAAEKQEETAKAAPAEKAKPAVKNYHVAHRPDGKWQVKFAKGEKAIKLFDTQAEAIAYAKKLAENQEGNITIHKKDGSIRKQKY